ncbi:UNVERIFIED_CONTAM: hypothetical protein K2H54_051173 [Gekko kuhli]
MILWFFWLLWSSEFATALQKRLKRDSNPRPGNVCQRENPPPFPQPFGMTHESWKEMCGLSNGAFIFNLAACRKKKKERKEKRKACQDDGPRCSPDRRGSG